MRKDQTPMGSDRRNRQRRPARGPARKEPKRRLLVFCEGEVTEPEYLRGLERWARNNTVAIEIAPHHGVPLTLVQQAVHRKDETDALAQRKHDAFLRFDEVWCVLDVDEHPHLHDVRQLANAKRIQLAVSNPCFELWLWLHFRDSPGARHRHDLQRMLGQLICSDGKHVDFSCMEGQVSIAINRASRLSADSLAEGEPYRNPTTTVFRLVESICDKSTGTGA